MRGTLDRDVSPERPLVLSRTLSGSTRRYTGPSGHSVPPQRCYAQTVTLRSTVVVLTIAALSACNGQLARLQTAVPTDGASVADAGALDATLHDASTSDARSSDARRTDAKTTDAKTTDAGATGVCPPGAPTPDAETPDAGPTVACPLATATTCGIGLAPCTGCCVESQCIAEGESCGRKGLGVCHSSSCGERGALGQLCATGKAPTATGYSPDGSVFCGGYEEWTGCTDTRSVCVGCECVPCGVAGQPCCDLGCGSHSYCDTQGQCSGACGAAGQPCCQGPSESSACDSPNACLEFGGPASCVPGSSCRADAGSCTTCGSQGQPCCDGGCNANSGASCFGDAGCMQIHMR
jgi:hypothetical protein